MAPAEAAAVQTIEDYLIDTLRVVEQVDDLLHRQRTELRTRIYALRLARDGALRSRVELSAKRRGEGLRPDGRITDEDLARLRR